MVLKSPQTTKLHRLVTAGLLLGVAMSAQKTEPVFRRDLLVGSWKANWGESTQGKGTGAQRPAMYRQYQDRGDGFMFHTVIVAPPGRNPELQLLGAIKYDDKEYPTYTPSRLADFLAGGKVPAQTVSFKVIDAYSMEWADRTSGKITAFGTMTLSQDGRTLRLTTKAPGAEGIAPEQVLIFEKQ